MTRGRDLEIRFITDLGRLEADKAAQGLTDIADAADLADSRVERIDDTVRGLTGRLEQLGRAGRTGLDKIDDSARRAGQGLDDLRSEAAATGREAAASFTGGFDDIPDALQEVAANAFAGFGPAGAAAGMAAAAGIGLLVSALQSSADEANATKERVIELATEIDQAGGNLASLDLAARIREWSVEIADNKSWWELWQQSNTTNLEAAQEAAARTGIAFVDMARALSGADSSAAARVLDQLNTRLSANADAAAAAATATNTSRVGSYATAKAYADERAMLEAAKAELLAKTGVTEDAIRLADLMTEATGRSAAAEEAAAAALQSHTSAIDAFASPVSVYTGLLAEKSAAEQTAADVTKVTVREYLSALAEQVTAQEEWAANLTTLAKRGVTDGVLAELEKMGPQGAPLIAQLATASDAELSRMVELFGRQGAAAAAATAEGITSHTGAVKDAAGQLWSGAARLLGERLVIPVDIESRWDRSTLERIRYDIANEVGTIVVPVAPGVSRYTNTTSNARYR